MNQSPLQQGTTLQILAPYLPYEIEVEVAHEDDLPERGLLTGFVHRNTCVRFQYQEEGELMQPFGPINRCLPILRPFSALASPLEDGTVPAVEVAKLLTDGNEDEYTFSLSRHEYNKGHTVLCYINDELVYQLDLVPSWDWWLSDLLATANHEEITVKAPAKVVDYLRSKHFAVGLEHHQYIEKK